MLSLVKGIYAKYDLMIDKEKLKFIRKTATTVEDSIFEDYCKEVHLIMQRHFYNKDIIFDSKELLLYLNEIRKHKQIQNILPQYVIKNYAIGDKFLTVWSYKKED